MSDFVLGGIFTLLGASLGALATLWAKKLEVDRQRQAEERERADNSARERREDYEAFLLAVTKAADSSKEVSRAKNRTSREELAKRSRNTWDAVLDAWASVSLTPSIEVRNAADDLLETVTAMVNRTDTWLNGDPEWDDSAYLAMDSLRKRARDQFRAVAANDVLKGRS